MSLTLYLFILLLPLIAYIFYIYTYDYGYWKRKGVYFIKPLPFFGNLYNVFNFRYSLIDLFENFYNKVDLPYFGIYFLNTPCLVVKDLEIIQSVLISDFSHFSDTIILRDERYDPVMSKSVVAAKSPDWKTMRGKISPIFTLAKIKNMFYIINEIAEEQNVYIAKNGTDVIETKELSTKYVTDIAASCIFGINAHSFEWKNTHLRNLGEKVFEFSYKRAFARSCYIMAHPIVKLFKLSFIDRSVAEGLREAILKTMHEREKSMHVRHDVIDIMIEMKNRGMLDDESIVPQLILLFLTAYDTTSTVVAFALFELALHPEMQDRLRSEIHSALSEHDGAFTYENVQSMNYLDMVFSETLRKYPPIGILDRICIKDYAIPGTDVVIEKGVRVVASVNGLHRDKKYFPEPKKFDPERFLDKNSIQKCSYMPLGVGPRNCVGERFGVIATKLSIAKVISQFELEPCDGTPTEPIEYESKSFFLGVAGGLPLRFKKLSSAVD